MRLATILIAVFAVTWTSLWYTPDQFAQWLYNNGDFTQAAKAFRDPMRAGIAWFRAGEFEKAERAFARVATAESEFNRGNCLVMQGKYDAAIDRYDRALQLRPGWEDALLNRSIASARAKQNERTGGDMGDQKIGADKIVYDKKKKDGGQDTNVENDQPMSAASMQAMWLRKVQTDPADFLKSKFAYQLSGEEDEASE